MKEVNIQKLSKESFEKFGAYSNMINPDIVKIGEEPIEFFRDMLQVNLSGTMQASISVCRVNKRALIIDTNEYHSHCGEGIMPLDGDVLIHVAPASPGKEVALNEIEVFHIPKGTFVSLKAGTWHHAPFAYQCETVNVLIVLPERTYANDCYVSVSEEKDYIRIME